MFWVVCVAGCSDSSSDDDNEFKSTTDGTEASVTPPTASDIKAQIAANNEYCMVAGLTFESVTLPECTRTSTAPDDLIYSVSGLPTWLAFDGTSRTLSLSGVSTVPEEVSSAINGTYTCVSASDSSLTGSTEFSINDCDGDGIVDNWEYHYSRVPCINPNNGASMTEPNSLDFYPGCQTGISVVLEGLSSQNASDAAEDPDGDGCNNLCEFTNGTNPFIATSNATFSTRTTYQVINIPYHGIVSADLNKDGNLDLMVTGMYALYEDVDDSVGILLGKGDITFEPYSSFSVAPKLGWVAPGYFDGDSNIDLAVVGYQSGKLFLYSGSGNGSFTQTSSVSISGDPIGITTADFNGDGKQDVVVTRTTGRAISIFLGNGDGSFTEKASYATTYDLPGRIVTADFNDDAVLDIAVTNYNDTVSSNPVSVFLGNGDGTFGEKHDYPAGDTLYGITSGDLNGDGHIDLVVAALGYNQHTTSVNVLIGDGSGGFASPVPYGSQSEYVESDHGDEIYENFDDAVVADLNGDAKLDIAATIWGVNYNDIGVCSPDGACATYGYVFIFLGNGDGTFAVGKRYDGGEGAAGDILAGDFDKDGDLDIAVSNVFANKISILENE